MHDWRKGKPLSEVIRITLREKWTKYNTTMKGMGVVMLVLIITMPLFLIIQLLPFLSQQQTISINTDQLKVNCHDKDFYIPWFIQCENVGVRPTYYDHK